MAVSPRVSCIVFMTAALTCSCSQPRSSDSDSASAAPAITLRVVDSTTAGLVNLESHFEADFSARTGIAVKSVVAGRRTESLFNQQLQWVKAGAAPDIFLLDNVWAGQFADSLLDLTPYVSPAERAQWIPGVLSSYVVGGKLRALPRETNFPVLYYRTDLLAKYGFHDPPETWDRLAAMALTIQTGERSRGNRNFWGWAWEGADSEALTCAAQEMQISSGAGHIVESNSTVSVNNPRAIAAFARAAGWIGRISPPGTSAYVEEDVHNLWIAGNAAFARDWVDGYRSSQVGDSAVKDKFAVAILPHDPGYASASSVGGMGYGVFKGSRHPDEAVRLLRFLTNRQAATWRLEQSSELPPITDLYEDSSLAAAIGFPKPFRTALFRSASPRPSALTMGRYKEVSKAYSKSVNSILCRRQPAAVALRNLEFELKAITGFPSGPPL